MTSSVRARPVCVFLSALLPLLMLAVGEATLPASAAFATEGSSATACNLYASPSGSDSASGTLAAPFATVQRLANALAAGQTGCLRGGTYTESVEISHGGTAGAPITLTSYPGERATVIGRFWIAEGSNHVTVEDLDLNGRNSSKLPSPTINSHYASFIADDITNEHTAICVAVGSDWGRAEHTVIEGDRIHDCGELPATNHQHGIYDGESVDTQIVDNVIFNNADRGIQLYPNAQVTVIEHNIIVGNGEGIIFSGADGVASSNTTVRENLITDARIRHDVESWYPSGNPWGVNNIVEDNCLWAGAEGAIGNEGVGFSAIENLFVSPEYAAPSTGDYRVSSASPCASLVAGDPVPTQPFGTSGSDTYTPASTESTTTTASTTTTESTATTATTESTTTTTITTSASSGESTGGSGGTTTTTTTTTSSEWTSKRKKGHGGGARFAVAGFAVGRKPSTEGASRRHLRASLESRHHHGRRHHRRRQHSGRRRSGG